MNKSFRFVIDPIFIFFISPIVVGRVVLSNRFSLQVAPPLRRAGGASFASFNDSLDDF